MDVQPLAPAGTPRRHLPLFLVGVACFVLGPVIYLVQVRAGSLGIPWCWPGLATVGVVCMAGSARRRPGVWRVGGLAVFSVVCGLLWYFFGVVARNPAYDGPARVGTRLPVFAATYADGRPFSDEALEDGTRSVLIFFRGRW